MTRLTVQNAEIKTATVEIQTLNISGKQVTLAVFRQLREEPLIAHDGTLNGVPWGVVNYHPDKCSNDREHWHVVWQRGTELLRSSVCIDPNWDLLRTDYGDVFLAAHLRDLLEGRSSPFFDGKVPTTLRSSGDHGAIVLEHEAGVTALLHMSERSDAYEGRRILYADIEEALETLTYLARKEAGNPPSKHWDDRKWTGEKFTAHIENLVERLDRIIGPHGREQATERIHLQFVSELRAEAKRRQRHIATCMPLADLPQLFIAV